MNEGVGNRAFLIVGEDGAARRRHLDAIRERLEAEFAQECERVSLDAESTPCERLGEIIETTPLFPGPRLVWIQGLERASTETLEFLLSCLPPKAPQTCVVLSAASLDRRKKAVQQLEQAVTVLKAEAPRPADIPAWIVKEASSRGLSLDRQAAEVLQSLVGDEPLALQTELEKLAVYAGRGGRLRAADVARLASRALPAAGEYAVFELVDAVIAGQRGRALSLLGQLLAAGRPALVLLAMFARQYRVLTAACGRPDLSPDALAKEMGIAPFTARKAVQQARQISLDQAIAGLEAILEADYRLKTGRDERLTLEMLVGELTLAARRG